eukprot:15365016-Ditylum_brightwellii.AAC.1
MNNDKGLINNDATDPDVVQFQWNQNHDWTKLENNYDDNFLNISATKQYESLLLNATSEYQRRHVECNNLKGNQILAHDMAVRSTLLSPNESSTDGGEDIGRLQMMLGQGGGGKSYVIDAIITTLIERHQFTEDNYKVCATTGKAATLVGGSTLHAVKEGLSIPCGRTKFSSLKGRILQDFQAKYKDKLKLLIIDEFTMIKQKELYFINKRLKLIMCNSLPFGGVTVLLVGDSAQLPPVGGQCLWTKNSRGQQDMNGFNLYHFFETAIELNENHHLDKEDSEAVKFYDFLQRLCNGENTEEDWNELRKNCSRFAKGYDRWDAEGFNSNDCVHLYPTNGEVQKHNHECLKRLDRPITLIEAEHAGRGSSFKPDIARSLDTSLFLAVGAKVLLTNNICQVAGLCNGATAEVKDIYYGDCNRPTSLPKFIIVDFGHQYTGPSFFPDDASRKGWVPIHAITAQWYTTSRVGNYDEHTRTMFPLRLSWAWTVWKAQGQTMTGKVSMCIGRGEKEHGLTYVAMSRVTKFGDIGLHDGITFNHLCKSIRKHKK